MLVWAGARRQGDATNGSGAQAKRGEGASESPRGGPEDGTNPSTSRRHLHPQGGRGQRDWLKGGGVHHPSQRFLRRPSRRYDGGEAQRMPLPLGLTRVRARTDTHMRTHTHTPVALTVGTEALRTAVRGLPEEVTPAAEANEMGGGGGGRDQQKPLYGGCAPSQTHVLRPAPRAPQLRHRSRPFNDCNARTTPADHGLTHPDGRWTVASGLGVAQRAPKASDAGTPGGGLSGSIHTAMPAPPARPSRSVWLPVLPDPTQPTPAACRIEGTPATTRGTGRVVGGGRGCAHTFEAGAAVPPHSVGAAHGGRVAHVPEVADGVAHAPGEVLLTVAELPVGPAGVPTIDCSDMGAGRHTRNTQRG